MKMNIKVSGAERLDLLLARELKWSRSQAQTALKSGAITVNGRIVKATYRLKTEDKVEQHKIKSKTELVESAPVPTIIAETKDYLVLNKPAGLLVHPTLAGEKNTLVAWLIKYYPSIKKVGEDKNRPGIVHRLDRAVSGLMVVAKNQVAFEHLKKQFQERGIVKEYQALVFGVVVPATGSINFPLARAAQGGKMAARPLNQEGKEALTEYQTAKAYHNFSLLKLIIKTGRTHQIRAHLAAINHPLVGDSLYGTRLTKAKNRAFALGRVWLYACRLGFVDLAGIKQEFKLPMPKELKEFLGKIK